MLSRLEMQGYLLVMARAFSGKRGRTGLISFMLGQAGPSTLELAREQGLEPLHGVLSEHTSQEIHLALTDLQQRGCLEIRETIIRDKSMPLMYLTDKGSIELERLRPSLRLPASPTTRTPEKLLVVLTRLGKLMEGLATLPQDAVAQHASLSANQLDHYMELICKALDIKREVPLSSRQAQKHFAQRLENALVASVFCDLPELEAQALRHIAGIPAKHQLSSEALAEYYPGISIRETARLAAARMLSREWQLKSPLVSVIGFLALSEPN